jgi:hypothetical protein
MPVDFEVLEVLDALAQFPGVTELLTYDSSPVTRLMAPDVSWFISFELDRDNIGRETYHWIRDIVGPDQRPDNIQVELLVKLLDERTALVTLQGLPHSRTGDLAEALRGAILLMAERTGWN